MGTVEPCTSFDGACFCQVCLFFFIMSVSWFVQLVSLLVFLSGEYDGGDIKDFISALVKFNNASFQIVYLFVFILFASWFVQKFPCLLSCMCPE